MLYYPPNGKCPIVRRITGLLFSENYYFVHDTILFQYAHDIIPIVKGWNVWWFIYNTGWPQFFLQNVCYCMGFIIKYQEWTWIKNMCAIAVQQQEMDSVWVWNLRKTHEWVEELEEHPS